MEPLEVTEETLFSKIGRLTVEVDALRATLAQIEAQAADDSDPPPA